MNYFVQSRFVDRNFAGFELFYFFGVVIHADDMMADVSKTGACHQTNVAGADN